MVVQIFAGAYELVPVGSASKAFKPARKNTLVGTSLLLVLVSSLRSVLHKTPKIVGPVNSALRLKATHKKQTYNKNHGYMPMVGYRAYEIANILASDKYL